NGSVLNVSASASFASSIQVDGGTGASSVTIDGTGTAVTGSTGSAHLLVAPFVGTGTVTMQNNATAMLGLIELADEAVAGTNGTFSILSNAHVSSNFPM